MRRDRETRLNGSRGDLANLCVTQPIPVVSRIGRNGIMIDSQGNNTFPMSPVSSNSSSNSELDSHKPTPMTPAGKITFFYVCKRMCTIVCTMNSHCIKNMFEINNIKSNSKADCCISVQVSLCVF